MKVVVDFIIEGKQEYEFATKEQAEEFVNYCNEVQTMQGGIRKITMDFNTKKHKNYLTVKTVAKPL